MFCVGGNKRIAATASRLRPSSPFHLSKERKISCEKKYFYITFLLLIAFMFFVFFSLFSLQHQLLKPTECIFLWKEIQFLFISSPSNFIIYFGLERTYLVITMSGNSKQRTIIILFFEQKSEIIAFPAEYLCCAEKFLQPYIIFQNGRGLDLKTQQYISHSQFHSPDIKTFHKSAFCFPR